MRLSFQNSCILCVFAYMLFAICYLQLPVFAQDLQSPQYQLQLKNVTITTPSDQANTAELDSQTLDQLQRQGYILHAGYPNASTVGSFSFSLSNSLLHLDEDSNDVKISATTENNGGYSITAAEEQVLHNLLGNSLANTHCDKNCTATFSNTWNNSQTFGFGYSISGQDALSDFHQGKRFRPFATLDKEEAALPIIQSTTGRDMSEPHLSTLHLKLNLSPDQKQTSYTTIIDLTAIPSY